MFPLWDSVIAPVLDAAGVERVVEIGALRGETTVQMLERLGPGVELHVIDPVPEFDPSEHEKQFPGRYVFHRDISHNVLPELPPVDAALIDGDHNWFTVYHELRMLSETARQADRPLPVMVMHDVGWPYGRRDLYYTPDLIPEEFRRPYAQRGMGPRHRKLLPEGKGGLSPQMNNAVTEGGPRNGVMTALDDFVAEYDRPLRRIVIPIYFGLAVLAEEEHLERCPELAAAFDRLESSEMRQDLLGLSESLRIKALVFQHSVFYGGQARFDRSANRYLNIVKKALLDEHHLENEVRLGYLTECLEKGQQPDPVKFRDPGRQLQKQSRQLHGSRAAGSFKSVVPAIPEFFPYTSMGRHRLDHLQGCLDTVRAELVDGDLIECGTGRGGGAIFMRSYLEGFELGDKKVWVADEFRAFPEHGPPASLEHGSAELGADLNNVRDGFDRFDVLDDRVRFLQGPLDDTLSDAPIEKLSLLRVDGSRPQRVRPALDLLYDRIALGGFIIVDGSDGDQCRRAVEEFRTSRGIPEPTERVDGAAVSWRKLEHAPAVTPRERAENPSRAPLAQPIPTDRCDLSIIVVFYNMKREATRTLHSLSRAYQHDVDGLDYEVIAVENGSSTDQVLGEEFVRTFGEEFRYLDLGDTATPSPANALNRGLELARGEHIGLMIDGAHVLTPGVLRYAMIGLETFAPAMAVAQQWYLGPGQQNDMMLSGYDQDKEDRLFERVEWPTNGYRLFDIGHAIGHRDWFDGLWESNCVLAPRALLEQVGAMDESFSMPGGGFANLDYYERIGATPGVTVVSMLGEASFHQVHGGTTTNQEDMLERARHLDSYGEHYTQLRGRGFRGPGKPIHFVGALSQGAVRSRARRMTSPMFFKAQDPDSPGGVPREPLSVPQDFRDDCIDFFWRSLAWKRTTWLGRPIEKCPTDLFAYQELVSAVRPDWIVETGRGDGSRALFLASICDLLGHGHVVSVDDDDRELPEHDRITNIVSHPLSPKTRRRVRELVGDEQPHALAVLGTRGTKRRMIGEFNTYSPLVPVGSYVVVEYTAVNGHPVWPEFGLGPFEAVNEIVNSRRGEFVADLSVDRYLVTFNPGGFLKRIK